MRYYILCLAAIQLVCVCVYCRFLRSGRVAIGWVGSLDRLQCVVCVSSICAGGRRCMHAHIIHKHTHTHTRV